MKKLQHNRGFTLVELVVSIAIMALIMVAIGGVMFSNNIIFRKTKSDIYVQNNAQDVYNKLNEDIMQAKHIYIKGYTSSGQISFVSNNIGAATTQTVTEESFLLPTDKYVLSNKVGNTKDFLSTCTGVRDSTSRDKMLDGMTDAEKVFYMDLLNTPEDQINAKLETCTQAERDTYVSLVYYSPSEVDDMKASMTDDEKKAFDSFWNRYRYMDNIQKDEAAVFLDSIPNASSTKNFDTLSKTEADGSKTYKYLYITEIVLVLSQNVDTSYCDASSLAKFNSDKAAMSSLGTVPTDQVTVKYTFGGAGTENQIKVDYSYKYMVKLNSSNYDSDILTKKLNYADAGGVPVPGCEAQIDAENDSMKIFLYFAENSMSYTDRGMVKLRNSYVLHDAK